MHLFRDSLVELSLEFAGHSFYNLSQALFEGLAPMLSALHAKDWHPLAGGIWLMLVTAIS